MKKMTLLLGLALAFSAQAKVGSWDDCGRYEIGGKIIRKDKALVLVVYAESQNEMQLTLSEETRFKTLPYMGQEVLITAKVREQIRNQRGLIEVEKVDLKVPDPMNMLGKEGFKLLKAEKCQKAGGKK